MIGEQRAVGEFPDCEWRAIPDLLTSKYQESPATGALPTGILLVRNKQESNDRNKALNQSAQSEIANLESKLSAVIDGSSVHR